MGELLSIAILALCYVVGAIPSGLLVSLYGAGIDIREHGSRNIGMTNVWRVLGWKLGLLTFLMDAGKAFAIVAAVPAIAGYDAGNLQILGGLAVLMGNLFNLFLGFTGGKGIASSLGVFLALAPVEILITFAIFGIIVALTRYISAGSLAAAVALPTLVYFAKGPHLLFAVVLVVAVIVIVKHRKNIGRLLSGTESKFGAKKPEAAATP